MTGLPLPERASGISRASLGGVPRGIPAKPPFSPSLELLSLSPPPLGNDRTSIGRGLARLCDVSGRRAMLSRRVTLLGVTVLARATTSSHPRIFASGDVSLPEPRRFRGDDACTIEILLPCAATRGKRTSADVSLAGSERRRRRSSLASFFVTRARITLCKSRS